jgi:hypothetical protein
MTRGTEAIPKIPDGCYFPRGKSVMEITIQWRDESLLVCY